MRVLVVDDNHTNRQILLNQIGAWQMQVDSAVNGGEALYRLRAAVGEGQPYNVALLDVQMPEMDGFMLAAAIKGDSALADTRLIVLTSMGHTLRPSELKQLGIEAYLVKPVKQSRLFDCLISKARTGAGAKQALGFSPLSPAAPQAAGPAYPGPPPEARSHLDRILERNIAVGLRHLRRGCRGEPARQFRQGHPDQCDEQRTRIRGPEVQSGRPRRTHLGPGRRHDPGPDELQRQVAEDELGDTDARGRRRDRCGPSITTPAT